MISDMIEINPVVKIVDSDNAAPKVKIPDPVEDIRKKYDFQTYFIIGIFAIAFLTMLLMVGGMLLDAWHFNSAIYKEYSLELDVIESVQNTNKELLEHNIQNQKNILELQQMVQKINNNLKK